MLQVSNLLLLKVQNTQTSQWLLSDINGCSSKAFNVYMIFYRPLLERAVLLQALTCLQSRQTS